MKLLRTALGLMATLASAVLAFATTAEAELPNNTFWLLCEHESVGIHWDHFLTAYCLYEGEMTWSALDLSLCLGNVNGALASAFKFVSQSFTQLGLHLPFSTHPVAASR